METLRLSLREFSVSDAPYFYELNLDNEVIKYTGDLPFKNITEAEVFLQGYDKYAQYGFGRWAVELKSSKEFIGWCGLSYQPQSEEVDLGFRFFKAFWNQGYASEASLFCLKYGFEEKNLAFIVGRAVKENTASIRVLQKIGMTYWKDFDFDGQKGVYYRLDKDDYQLISSKFDA
jgi:[ribosomal protein S5]-alanine N-acetyltransferase